MRVRLARTSWVTSFTIFALVFGGIVVNHFAKRTLPIHESKKRQEAHKGVCTDLALRQEGYS
jgi:hypothetical protein